MKKFVSCFIVYSVAICGGLFALPCISNNAAVPFEAGRQKPMISIGPIEQARAYVKVKEPGVYEVNYSLEIIQHGIAKSRVKPGFIIVHKETNSRKGKSEFYSLSPKTYVIDRIVHNKTESHCTGKAVLRLRTNDVVLLGLLKTHVSETRPKAILKHATISLIKTPLS